MLRHLTVVGVILATGVVAAPHPQAIQPEHAERDLTISGATQLPSTWVIIESGSWDSWTSASTTPPTETIVVTQSGTSEPATSVPATTSVLSLASGSSAPVNATGPCASVSVLYAAFTNASPQATANPTVPAQLAYECLNTIPFNQSDAIALLNSAEPYLDWQTTFEYLKDPPAEYAEKVQAPYDFWATWNVIKANVSAYQTEYEFGWTLYRAAQLAHDAHFNIWPAIIVDLFNFGRDLPLVSVSLDGVSEPQPYLYSDIVASNSNTSFTPSPIVEINGQDAVEYLLVWSQYGSLTDPDALWNNLFWEPAQIALGYEGTGTGSFTGGGTGQYVYPGPSTTLTFANGSTVTQQNYAEVLFPFTNVTSGEDVYQALFSVGEDAYQDIFQEISQEAAYSTATASSSAVASFTANASATASESAAYSTAGASTTAGATSTVVASTSSGAPSSSPTPGYPPAFISDADDYSAGYFINASGYEDVAVLAVRSFVSDVYDETAFQSVNTYFIETAAAMGKTKLIIDLSGNGGGTILQGYDLFKQLFPSILPYGASRYRAHEAFNLLGEQASYLSGLVPRSLNDNETIIDVESTVFDYQTPLDVDYEPFTSWAELYGPHALGPQPDNFTSILRWNLSDVLIPIESGGIDISGYLNRTNITAQPFAAENIVILTDGYCASTCTIFAELMTSQGGVKTVALGGRPQPGIIQAIGGTKGVNNADIYEILGYIMDIYDASNSSLQAHWQTTVLNQYNLYAPERLVALGLNVRNGYLPNETVPLQFVYQPADCRILYTPAMVVDETAVWKTVADSVWGGGKGNACVAGGFGVGNTTNTAASSTRARDVQERELHTAREGIDYEAILNSLSFRGGYGYIGTDECLFG